MGINHSYLYVIFLVSLSVSCTSDCPMSDSAYDQPGYHECTKLYNGLETALVENQDNLLLLHENLFPSSSSQPTYAMVSFNVHELNKKRKRCYISGAECYSTCWTSSLLLRSVGPLRAVYPPTAAAEHTTTNSGCYWIDRVVCTSGFWTEGQFYSIWW